MGVFIFNLCFGGGGVDTPLPTMKLCNNSSKLQAKEFSFNVTFIINTLMITINQKSLCKQ